MSNRLEEWPAASPEPVEFILAESAHLMGPQFFGEALKSRLAKIEAANG